MIGETRMSLADAGRKRQCHVHCVQKKNTHSHFISCLHEWCTDLNKNCKNCSEYT